jgi:hypothetical protein
MNAARRRFLVIVRAGDGSLHPQWTSSPETRTWDLVVSYYGSDPDLYRDSSARRIDDKGQKWEGLHRLLTRESFWRDYDFVWLPDDDIASTQEDIGRLFELMAELDLDIAQPTLDWHSHFSHAMTLRWPSFSVRFTNFVEIMAPCFKRSFLETCVPTFGGLRYGWGLDFVWPAMLGGGLRRSAMLDSVSVTHTRPVGGPTYDRLRAAEPTPLEEGREILRRHAIPAGTRQMVTGAIDRDGRFLHGADPAAVPALTAMAQRDWAAIGAYRAALDAGALGVPETVRPAAVLPAARLGEILAANLPRA